MNNSNQLVRVGVLGCGYWGAKHARVLTATSGVSDVVLIDSDPKTHERLQQTFGSLRRFHRLEEALPYIDALMVATPPSTHAELAIAAMRHEKHVMVEKPLATSVADARAMIAQADRSDVVLMVGHTFQYNPALRELRRRVVAGELGDILYAHTARLNLGLYQPDVDVVWDLAPHDVSILNYLLDATPSAVTAWGESLTFGGISDLASVRLEFSNPKVICYVHISWLDPRKTRKVTLVGCEKMAIYDDLAEERLRIYDRGVGAVDDPPSPQRPLTYRYGDIIVPHIQPDEPLAVQDRHFINSIITGTRPETDGSCGLAVVSALEAISASMQQHKRILIKYVPNLANLACQRA